MSAATRYAYDTQTTIQIVAYWCNGCGIPYGLPEGFIEQRREDHATWTCPNGCRRAFNGPTAADKERERLKTSLYWAEYERDAARQVAKAADYRARAAKAKATRERKRIANGVCPCCSRTFADLARHMAGQHPDYAGGVS